MQTVDVGELAVSAYRTVAPDWILDTLPYGGGVSPLYRDLGVHTDWKIISGEPEFFAAIPRLVLDELTLRDGLAHDDPLGSLMTRDGARDPVGGLSLVPGDASFTATCDGAPHRFCSAGCRDDFLAAATKGRS